MESSLLATLLLAAIVASALSTLGLFLPLWQRLGGSWWMWSRRLFLALVGTVIVAAVGAGSSYLVHGLTVDVRVAFVVLVAASVVWLPVTRRWNARAHLAWSSSVFLFLVYLAFMLDWTFSSPLGPWGLVGALLLWALETFAALLGCAYLWELCDALGSEHWPRRIVDGVPDPAMADELPFVSLHVPAHEEPPDMVIETLLSLTRLDYPNYEIIAIDDNTTDESLWRPVEAWCHANGVKFAHLQNWPGYKSGALNYALKQMTDPRAEVIGVVDSDYQLERDFLSRCAPLFADPKVGFVQSPQDYREWADSAYFRRLYYSYKYFFDVSQPSRNERDGAIFAGTMGLIRKEALVSLGGWDEWCITEDAELSLRLLRSGWSGHHVDASFGRGVMPLTFEALKQQRFRWCFGGIQILRMHWRSMLPGRRSKENRLSIGQRWAYLSGALQWYGDLISVLFFLFLMAGAVNIGLGGGLLFRKLSAFLVAAIPLLVGLGFARAVALIRRGTGATWSDAFGAFFIWQATTLSVARASVQALFAREAEFLRTPKTGEDVQIWKALAGNRAESLLALAGLGGIAVSLAHANTLSGALTATLLVLPTAAFASAPVNSLAAQRTQLPPVLEARRRSEYLRGGMVRRSIAAATSMGAVTAATALVLVLLSSGGRNAVPPDLMIPKPGTPHGGTQPASPANTPSPTTSPTLSTSPTPSTSPSTSPTPTATPTGSPTPSTSPSTSPTPTGSPSPSPSGSPSGSPSPSPTPSPSGSPSPSPSASAASSPG